MLSEYNMCDNINTIKAIETSEAKYIAFLDGDDYWTSPFKLQKQVDLLDNNPELSMCFHNIKVFHENENLEYHDSSYYG